jgi:hypothetical protein
MLVADVGAHSKLHGIRIEFLGRGRSANPTGVPLARVFSDRLLGRARAAREKFGDTPCERFNVRRVEFYPSGGCPLPRSFAGGRVRQALSFCLYQRGFLDQHALTFIPLPSATESHNHGMQG